jgi:hypothetical protein
VVKKCKGFLSICRESDLDRDAIKWNDELNAIHLLSLQPGIVSDEQINSGSSATRELDGVGCPE